MPEWSAEKLARTPDATPHTVDIAAGSIDYENAR